MKKQLAILSDNDNSRLVIDHIVAYYLSVNLKSDSKQFKLIIFWDYPFDGKPPSEEFFYSNESILKDDGKLLDSFFDARDASGMDDKSRLDSLV